MVLQSRVSGLHLVQLQEKKETKSGKVCHNIGKEGQVKLSHHLVGASNLEGSALGEESLGEGMKFHELDCGRLGLSLLLDGRLPQLVSPVLHLLEDLGMAGINCGVNRGKQGGNFLLSGAAVLLDLGDGAIQGDDDLPRLLLSW